MKHEPCGTSGAVMRHYRTGGWDEVRACPECSVFEARRQRRLYRQRRDAREAAAR